VHRRPLGRGRLLVLAGAAAILVGCLLPWHSIGGSDGLPLVESRGLAGSGIVTFLAAIGALAVVALPYASGGRPVGLDRTVTFALLTGLAIGGLVIWPIEFVTVGAAAGLLPTSAPGYWIAIAGSAVMARGTYLIAREPHRPW
jgi:hypothetical protein